MPCWMHHATLFITASGCVKSTATSAASATARSSPRSRAATNCNPSAAFTAMHTSAPIRPRAPNTATFTSWATKLDRRWFLDHRNQRQLAPIVHLVDLHLDLLTDADDVLHVLHASATRERPQLGDVQQAVFAWEQRHECTEGGDLHYGPQVALALLRHGGIGNRVDHGPGGLGLVAAVRSDVDRPVVLDGDLRAGVVLNLVDHLALGADDFADLVDRNLQGDDPRGVDAHLVRRVDGLTHYVEQGFPSDLGLLQGTGQHRGWNAVQLGVQLKRGDEVPGPGDLEVHIPVSILGTQDVGEGHITRLAVNGVGYQTHRDTGDWRSERHTRIQQGERRRTHRAHRSGSVGAESLRDLTNRVRKLFAVGQDGHQRPLSQRTMPTSADKVRMSDKPRPSIRTRSRRMRCRTSFLVRARYAPAISLSRPSNWPLSCSRSRLRRASVCSSRACLSPIDMTSLNSPVTAAATASYTSSE